MRTKKPEVFAALPAMDCALITAGSIFNGSNTH
ncbi:hypothetical protein CLV42_12337 [Chitinophaga ginsengisoli]|uniref:Uncharacterized protein n=1 Tax=Chitinophaga ginsengisoli TaxID=363837 RepID=A0A2P8FID7_9BACT|nr:hypothetical protein CLV42_12337 [Chitinophaga ginsengisoli]